MRPGLSRFRFELHAPVADTPTSELAGQLQRLPAGALPLQRGCIQGGWADAANARLALIGSETDQDGLEVTIMAYFEEIVGGCNCSEDPVRYPAMLRMRMSVGPDGFITAIEPSPE